VTQEQRNVELLRNGYGRWAESKGASIEEWLEIASDEMVLHTLGGAAAAVAGPGARRGKAALRDYLEVIGQNWIMLDFAVQEFIAQGERVVVLSRSAWCSRLTGRQVEIDKVDIWRIRDGKAVEFTEFYDTAGALAAAQGG
jgi:ketosteroid isomerase-like protein